MYATCFDRVTVIYEGQMVFSGRTTDAVAYFTEQGWQRKARQTYVFTTQQYITDLTNRSVPDFLTACTSPTERIKRADHQGFIPQTPVEMAEYFKASPAFKKLQDDIVAYKVRSF
jgi:ATP-binding cassette subfamily G (WHITE) protein 2 (SNQ2)